MHLPWVDLPLFGLLLACAPVCHDCGYKNPLVKDLSVREWACPSCGVLHDRDVNAARNIRDEAMRIIE